MKALYLPAELAGLPGMPGTDGAVRRMAKRANWRVFPRPAGKGVQYHLDDLPESTRAHLIQAAALAVSIFSQPTRPNELPDQPAPSRPGTALAARVVQPNDQLADWQRQVRDARLIVLAYLDVLRRALGDGAAVRQVAAMAKAGTLPPEISAAAATGNARSGAKSAPDGRAPRTLSTATLYRWMHERTAQGVAALAPAPQPIHHLPAWTGPFLAIYQDPNKPSAARCVRALLKTWPADQPQPNPRAAQLLLAKLPIEVREYGRRGTRAMRAIKPFCRRTTDGLWPMDIVAVDGHSQRAYVRRPDSGRRIRPEVTTYVDIATRRIVGVSLWWAESQYAIWIALRTVVLHPDQGVPALQYSDNGAYRGAEHLGVLSRIGTEPTNARAYNPQANGAIETINRTVWHPLAKTQPTYCGKDADQEQFKRQLAIADADGGSGGNIADWSTWTQICLAEVADYNARPHDRLRDGRTHISPDTAWARAVDDGWRPTLLDGDDLHDLLPSTDRKTLRGEVTLPWGRYFSQELAPYHGKDVRVAYDPADGTRVWVRDLTGRVLAIAERDANARPYMPADKIEHARNQREAARILRLERRKEIVQDQERPALEALEGVVINLPDLALTPTVPAVPDLHPEAREVLAALERPSEHIDRLASDPERYQEWLVLRSREGRGELLSPREQGFVESFGKSDYCRLMQRMQSDFDNATKDQAAQ